MIDVGYALGWVAEAEDQSGGRTNMLPPMDRLVYIGGVGRKLLIRILPLGVAISERLNQFVNFWTEAHHKLMRVVETQRAQSRGELARCRYYVGDGFARASWILYSCNEATGGTMIFFALSAAAWRQHNLHAGVDVEGCRHRLTT